MINSTYSDVFAIKTQDEKKTTSKRGYLYMTIVLVVTIKNTLWLTSTIVLLVEMVYKLTSSYLPKYP